MMMQVKNLTVTQSGKTILHGIDTTFPAGGTSLILGRNGSGKSTLLKALAGLVKPVSGEILLGNTALSELSPREVARQCAVLLQDPSAPPEMTVQTLVSLGRFPHKSSRSENDGAVNRALADMDICHLASRSLASLSGGERRKAFLARALAQETGILILDEPDAALDAAAKNELLNTMRELKHRRHLTVIMAAHDWDFALNAADQVCALNSGNICFAGTPDALAAPEVLQKIFGISGIAFRDAHGKLRILPEYSA